MKKRMQILMSLTLTAFLFLGLTNLNAQSYNTGPVSNYGGPTGKTELTFQSGMDAINTLRAEMQTTFDLNNLVQPNTPANALTYHHFQYMVHVQDHIGSGKTTADAIVRAYNEIVEMAKATFPNAVDAAWQDQMVVLLAD